MKTNWKLLALAGLCFIGQFSSFVFSARGQGTAFTYQGRLNSGGAPANGWFDFRFRLDADPAGNTILTTAFTNALAVSNGLFTTTIDFGPGWFNGSNYWLEVDVRTNGAAGYIGLIPLQPLTPTPYATFANTASNLNGTLGSASLAGAYGNAVTLNNAANQFTGTFTGNGAGVSNVNAVLLSGMSAGSFWQLGGNNVAGGQFLGSTNNQPVELWVNGARALRLEPSAGVSPNIIGGSSLNYDVPGLTGATIGGGAANRVTGNGGSIGGGFNNAVSNLNGVVVGGVNNTAGGNASSIGGGSENDSESDHGAIAGGQGNVIQNPSEHSFIGGGQNNAVQAAHSVIGGGRGNLIQTNAFQSVLGGGLANAITTPAIQTVLGGGQYNTNGANQSFIGSGTSNAIQFNAYGSVVAGGWNNLVGSNATMSVVAGGHANVVQAQTFGSAIGGGEANTIQTYADHAFIGGGGSNTIVGSAQFPVYNVIGGGFNNLTLTNAIFSAIGGGYGNTNGGSYAVLGGGYYNLVTSSNATVPGGTLNVAGGVDSFAAGQQAQALHQGAFVWADSQNSPFASTANDQFLIRAQGGVGINANNLGGATLYVQGNRAGGWQNSATWLVNTNSATNTAPALRVVNSSSNATNTDGALSVSVDGQGLIAEFGNGVAYVVTITNDGTVYGTAFVGNGGRLTALNAANLTSGTIPLSVLNPAVVTNGAGSLTLGGSFSGAFSGTFTGNGNGLTNLNASQLTSIGLGSGNFFVGPAGNAAETGPFNVAMGSTALNSLTSGNGNTALGYEALYFNTNGSANTAVGEIALPNNRSGYGNSAFGADALLQNTIGSYNAAIGGQALALNTTGSNNIALGYNAGQNLQGSGNIAIGNSGLSSDNNIIRIGSTQTAAYLAGTIYGNGGGLTNLNASQLVSGLPLNNFFVGSGNPATTGSNNVALGPGALAANIVASDSTAIGFQALNSQTGSGANTAVGFEAIASDVAGLENTAVGALAMAANTNGSYNTVLGGFALFSSANGNYNTAVGEEALNQSQGSGNIALGYQAGRNSASGSTNIYIGHAGNSTENNTIRIGTPGSHSNTYIAGIVTDVGGVQVGSSGTVIANLQAGQAIMPPSLLQETNFTIAFPTAYSSTPKILFSIANDPGFQNVSDVFASSISSNGPSGFSVNVYRLNGTSWGQSLRVNWQAWQ